jgi:pyruvate,water dikinase
VPNERPSTRDGARVFARFMEPAMAEHVKWFAQINLQDVAETGGKNASLGELVQALTPLGVRIPDGFAITASAFRRHLDAAGLAPKLAALLDGADKDRIADFQARAGAARELVRNAPLLDEVWAEVREAYERLVKASGGAMAVAVRSSATAEDLPQASFAGQHESYLNVCGHEALRAAILDCYASLYSDRAIAYRIDQGFAHAQVALSVGIQRMVRSDLGCSGVAFTLDPETGFRDVVLVSAAWGLGENVVKGAVDPDEVTVFKPTLALGLRPIVRRKLGSKQLRMQLAPGLVGGTENRPTAIGDQRRYCLEDDEVLELARQAVRIEEHYSRVRGASTPMDIEWAKDGTTGEIFVVQARPETVESRRQPHQAEHFVLEERGPVLAHGSAVGHRIGAGVARQLRGPAEMAAFQAGEVLVAEATSPDWEPVMKKAAAIVTDHGGRTCHAAIVARELGIPAIVGAGNATQAVRSGQLVTVSCAEGDSGQVYAGRLRYRVDTAPTLTARPRTKMMMNIGDPGRAFDLCTIPNDGVGLARIEFIVGNAIGIHPMALLHPSRIGDPYTRAKVFEKCAGKDPARYFVDKLAEGVATIAAAFWPKPVTVRLSDFKSNEYAQLLGGRSFEPIEENPMLGLRGAARYYHPSYREAFALECRALREVRENMGLENVRIMVPFCRRVEEAMLVLSELERHGLVRGKNGLQILVMCEIPNNVLRIDDFCQLFDGISIGSNDLTQLTLGVDRDSELVSGSFDEHDPGVLKLIREAIAGAKRNGRHSGICGQAPSDHPDIAAMLVRWGIDSISLSPDTLLATTARVLEVEKAMAQSAAPAAQAHA